MRHPVVDSAAFVAAKAGTLGTALPHSELASCGLSCDCSPCQGAIGITDCEAEPASAVSGRAMYSSPTIASKSTHAGPTSRSRRWR